MSIIPPYIFRPLVETVFKCDSEHSSLSIILTTAFDEGLSERVKTEVEALMIHVHWPNVKITHGYAWTGRTWVYFLAGSLRIGITRGWWLGTSDIVDEYMVHKLSFSGEGEKRCTVGVVSM